MKFIKIEMQDLEDLAKQFKAEFSQEPWNEPWTYETSYHHLKTIYDSAGFCGYKVYENDFIGFILGNRDPSYMGDLFWIKELCVFSSYQLKGYGKRILKEFEELLKAQEIVGILLWTNHATSSFYEKSGYQKEDELFIMKKVLKM